MTSINVKLRPSTVEEKEGNIYYQIIHNRVIRQLKTDYTVFQYEWSEKHSDVITDGERCSYLQSIKECITWDLKRLNNIAKRYEQKQTRYSADDIIETFLTTASTHTLFNFMKKQTALLQQMGKHRTAEAYHSTLKSFMKFRKDRDLLIDDIDSDLMACYEAHLRNRGVSKNSSSFYMRILRAVYNRVVEKELTTDRHPFKHVYTGIDKTVKRALPLKTIREIKRLTLPMHSITDLSRDLFLFSFYTRGMSFIDMAYLKKKDLSNGILTYRRSKTGQQLHIRWERCMQEIIEKYKTDNHSPYMLPIITTTDTDERAQYKNMLYRTNKALKNIARMAEIPVPLTMYVARHSWASAARSKNIPVSVISEGMGHDSEQTTRIYLASLDTAVIDKANRLILKDL
jgi:integrase